MTVSRFNISFCSLNHKLICGCFLVRTFGDQQLNFAHGRHRRWNDTANGFDNEELWRSCFDFKGNSLVVDVSDLDQGSCSIS